MLPEITVTVRRQERSAQRPTVQITARDIAPRRGIPLVIAEVVEAIARAESEAEADLRRERGPASDVVAIAPRDPARPPDSIRRPQPTELPIERPAPEVEDRPTERLVAAPGLAIGSSFPMADRVRAPFTPYIGRPYAAITAVQPAPVTRQRLDKHRHRVDRLAVGIISGLGVAGRIAALSITTLAITTLAIAIILRGNGTPGKHKRERENYAAHDHRTHPVRITSCDYTALVVWQVNVIRRPAGDRRCEATTVRPVRDDDGARRAIRSRGKQPG